MQVILQRDVSGKGKKGEIKDFAPGFAKFLVAKGDALEATPKGIKTVENEQRQQKAKEEKEIQRMKDAKKKLEKETFEIAIKAGESGKLFGSPQERDIVQLIRQQTDIEVEKNDIKLPNNLRSAGEYEMEVKLGSGIVAKCKLVIRPITK